MIFTSFYTPEYADVVVPLIESLERFDLPYYIPEYPSRGNWLANCYYTPKHCKEILDDRPGGCVVFLDADAVVRKYPSLLYDLAATKTQFAYHSLRRRGNDVGEALNGTMFIRSDQCTRQFFTLQTNRCQGELERTSGLPKIFEQKIMQEMLDTEGWGECLRTNKLPASYCRITGNILQTPEWDGCAEEDAYIVHYQASRRMRDAVG